MNNIKKNKNINKKNTIIILQILILINATLLGWTVSICGKNMILKKKICDINDNDDNLDKLLSNIIPIY